MPATLGAAALSAGVIWLVSRPKVVLFNAKTATITVAWELMRPALRRQLDTRRWRGLRVRRVQPVGLSSRGGGRVSATQLPPAYHLEAVGGDGGTTLLAALPTAADATGLSSDITTALGRRAAPMHLDVRLALSAWPARSAELWQALAPFTTDPEAARLYQALGDAGRWQGRRADCREGDIDGLLDREEFDVDAQAWAAGVARPWATVERLVAAGWVTAAGPWTTPNALAEMAQAERSVTDGGRAIDLVASQTWMDPANRLA